MFNRKKLLIISSICIVLIAAIVFSCTLIFKSSFNKSNENVTFYGFSESIDLTKYLPLTKANQILKDNNGIAVTSLGTIAYFDGDYHEISDILVEVSEHNLFIDGEKFKAATGKDIGEGLVSPEDAAKKLGLTAHIHDEKIVVFLSKELDINVYDNFYVFEMISLKLKDAPLCDFENAFLNLPSCTSNDDNIYNIFTDSDLELGLSTDLYSLQGVNINSASSKTCPKIVAGEGEDSSNHTLIRVYNEYQSKTAQFMAFPGDVTGGVKVSCGTIKANDESRGLIATACFDVSKISAKAVKVYDEYGVLYMNVVPNVSSPYNILINNEKLLITSENTNSDGALPYEIYDLTNGELVKSGSQIIAQESKDVEVEISRKENETVIVYDSENYNVYTGIFGEDDKFEKANITIDSNTNGVYASAFSDGGFVTTISLDSENYPNRSFVRIFGEDDIYGDKTDVGVYENIFYWNYSGTIKNVTGCSDLEIPDTTYMKRASFMHVRTDLNSTAMLELSSVEKINIVKEADYYYWTGSHDYTSYLTSYNVWEPCFTHRFNATMGACVLAKYKDADGFKLYLGYTASNETSNYTELDSSFLNATYAEGILLLDKMRIYNLRDYLQNLYNYFEQSPENLVGLEPIHEIEINVGSTVGDYNPENVEGFRSYLLERFGSIENINTRFGTDFATREDIDAPRNGALGSRGEWDAYKGDYFIEWCLFTRKMVNKRLTESFREAALAGFPSEIISGHSIPEGDAISGFLGQADTRMSPVDAMMTLGCNFGATRYGTWFQNDNNYLINARLAGFKNMTMGEYNSMANSYETALNQLRYVWTNGGKYINILNVDEEGVMNDLYSLKTLSTENNPRPGSSKGTTSSAAVNTGDKVYQIVELGGTSSDNGLLKSVDENGSWTGDIYLSPFHSAIEITTFDLSKSPRFTSKSPIISDLNTGDVVEINFIGSYTGKGNCTLHIDVYEDGILSSNYSETIEITGSEKQYKYTLYNDVPLGEIQFVCYFETEQYGKLEISEFSGIIEREQIVRKYFGDYTAKEHVGGVTFDYYY